MKCPYCQHDFIPTQANVDEGRIFFMVKDHTNNYKFLDAKHIVCPNQKCRQPIIYFRLSYCYNNFSSMKLGQASSLGFVGERILERRLIPDGASRKFPEYIPQALLNDYEEACKIAELSPKASATLARRCLQGMIRDFHKITKRNLAEEINALKGTISSELWDAIDTVRSVGNIGAHMEKDVNVIVDIDPDEARQLIGLIELLFDEWYVQREERAKGLQAIKALGDAKQAQRRSPSGNST